MATPYTAEWYKNLASQIKAKTWKTSERSTEMDRLDLMIANKLAKAKPKLAQLEKDPVAMYSLSPNVKRVITVLKKYSPSLFKEAEPTVWPKTPSETALAQAKRTAVQAETAGFGEGALAGLEKYGVIPKDYFKKNIWGQLGATAAFPLKKVMSALYAFPRGISAAVTETYKQHKIGEPSPLETQLDVLRGLKAGAKAFINMPGEYQDYTWSKAFKEMLPGTKFTKPFEITKGWEQGNRWQRALSGLGGSPADIVGLAMDILLDPITYLSGGLGVGARTGIKLPFKLFAKGGRAVLPKGATLGLTKVGRKVLKPAAELAVESTMKGLIKKGGVKAGTAIFEITKRRVTKKILLESLEQTVKNLPYEEAIKLIDYGGLKLAGKTVIPGYKIAGFTKPIITRLEKTKLVSALEGMFWTGKGIPEELRPYKHLIESTMRKRFTEGTELFADITKGLSKTEMGDLGKYLWMSSDVARLQGLGKAIPVKLTSQLDDLARRLNPKQLTAAARYQDEFAKGFLAKFEKELGIKYPELTRYYPSRYMAGKPKIFQKFEMGAKHAPFEEIKKPYLQIQKLIKEGKLVPKTFERATMQRLLEHTSRSGRELFQQEVKQFGRPFKTAGMVDATSVGLKNLKGWYLPEDIIKPLTRMQATFYGDEAFKYTMSLVDKGVQIWKKAALFTPGYHFRNFWTDTISGMMEYGPKFLNPRYWDEAIKIKLNKHVPIKSLGGMFGDDAQRLLMKTGEIQSGMYAIEAGRAGGRWGGFMKNIDWQSLPAWKGRTPFALSRKLGGAREDMGRVVASLIEREAGSSSVMAAEQVAKVFFNYADITPFERQFMRRAAIPFYTWIRKNIARQTELLFTRTGAYAAIPKVSKFVEGMTKIPEGYREYRPDYFADLFAIMTPFRTQAGIPLALNPNFAWQDWSRLSPRDMASMLNPMLKIPIELITGREIFFNRPIGRGKLVEAPKALNWAKKLPTDILENFAMSVSKDNKLYMTDTAYYFWRQNPLFYNLARLYPAEMQPKTPYDWLSILVGIKFFPYEEEKSKQFYYQDFRNSVSEKIGQQRQLGRQIPDTGQIERAYRQIYANYLANKYPNYAVAQNIREKTKYVGSTKKINLMVKLMEKPYIDEMDKIKDMSLPELGAMLSELGIKPTESKINIITNQARMANVLRGG